MIAYYFREANISWLGFSRDLHYRNNKPNHVFWKIRHLLAMPI